MKRSYTYTIQLASAKEGGYIASVPVLPGCFTQGDTYEEAVSMARDAIRCYVEGLLEMGKTVPVEPANATEVRVAVNVPAFA